ncbi:MAG: DUF1330 domain-containing protein [Nannocystaceae bacterium]|nr:DUF1330 domain-containing protein [Nannocystaceae bacterium]
MLTRNTLILSLAITTTIACGDDSDGPADLDATTTIDDTDPTESTSLGSTSGSSTAGGSTGTGSDTGVSSDEGSTSTGVGVEPPVFIVTLLELDPGTEFEVVATYLEEVEGVVGNYDGLFVAPPLRIDEPVFENPGSPDTTQPAIADVVLVAQFPNFAQYEAFFDDDEVSQARTVLDEGLSQRTRLRTTTEAPVPLFQTMPDLGELALREAPALTLHNAIKLGPDGPPLDYIEDAVPMAQAAGTQFFRPFQILEVLEGTYDFHLVFLTEWESFEALETFHNSPEWLDIVPTRNANFENLIEGLAHFEGT